MTIRLRLGLVSLLAATALVGCGKKEEAPPADAAAGGAAAPAAAGAEEKVVNVYNWSDYIDPAMLEKFTEEVPPVVSAIRSTGSFRALKTGS